MLSNLLKKGLLSSNLRYASTSGQQTVLVVLYEGLIDNLFLFCNLFV